MPPDWTKLVEPFVRNCGGDKLTGAEWRADATTYLFVQAVAALLAHLQIDTLSRGLQT